jgi:hypothetical protein
MIPDMLHVIIPLYSLEMKNTYSLPGAAFSDPDIRTDLSFMCGTIIFGLCLCSIL